MRKATIGVLLGAVVYFAAGSLSWMVFPWMDHGIKKLPEETLIRDTLKVVVKESAVYNFPDSHTENGPMDYKTYTDLYKSGPAGLLFIQMAGPEPMSAKTFVTSGIISLGVAIFCMGVLMLLGGRVATFGGRLLTVVSIGVFSWFSSIVPFWNWMFFPTSFVGWLLLDALVAYGLLGLVLAKFVPSENR